MSTMSGSSRSAARSASLKLCVSLCTSRWFTRQFLCWWMYSIGSSIVRMCSLRSALILSSIAASVVDLPLPVGPVTSTRPRGRSASVGEDRRQAELAEAPDLLGNQPVDGADRAALVEDVAAEAREAVDAEREVELQRLFEALLLRVGQHAVDQLLGLGRRQLRQSAAAAAGRARAPAAACWSTRCRSEPSQVDGRLQQFGQCRQASVAPFLIPSPYP